MTIVIAVDYPNSNQNLYSRMDISYLNKIHEFIRPGEFEINRSEIEITGS
jgi:hypothetical protein